MFKYEIGQKVWLICDNKINHGTIKEKIYLKNEEEEKITYYVMPHGWFNHDRVFISKQDLLDHLSKTADGEG